MSRKLEHIYCYVVIVIALLAIAGWLLDVRALVAVIPNYASMKVNTAIGLIGIALMVLYSPQNKMYIPGAVALLIGLLTIMEYAWQVDFGIDNFLHVDTGDNYTSHLGRQSPFTSICLVVLFFMVWIKSRVVYHILFSFYLYLLASALTLLIFRMSGIINIPMFTGMAINTLACLSLLVTAIDKARFARRI